jgi:hypothetical protein
MNTTVLLNSAGTPEPSPEIQRRLRKVHPGLHLRLLGVTNEHWTICMGWPENDSRREWIQRGEYDPDKAYDIIGYLPLDCSVDQAPALLERSLRAYPKEEMSRIAENVTAYNSSAPVQEAVESAIAEVLDSADPSGALVKRRPGRPRKNP